MGFKIPQTKREVVDGFWYDGGNDFCMRASYKYCLSEYIHSMATNKATYELVTSFLDNTAEMMTYQLLYNGDEILKPFVVRLKDRSACTYASQLSNVDRNVTLMEIIPPDFSLVHLHADMAQICENETFLHTLCAVVVSSCYMLSSRRRVHVVILQPGGGTDKRKPLMGLNDTHSNALWEFIRTFKPCLDLFSINTPHDHYNDRFLTMHLNCVLLLQVHEASDDEDEEDSE